MVKIPQRLVRITILNFLLILLSFYDEAHDNSGWGGFIWTISAPILVITFIVGSITIYRYLQSAKRSGFSIAANTYATIFVFISPYLIILLFYLLSKSDSVVF